MSLLSLGTCPECAKGWQKKMPLRESRPARRGQPTVKAHTFTNIMLKSISGTLYHESEESMENEMQTGFV